MLRLSLLVAAATLWLHAFCASAADWPQYRFDAGRTAASPDALSDELHLAWVRQMPAPEPAFPTELRLRFDATYEPVVLGQTMFVPSMVTDSLTALDTQTGAERWRFFADGPIRLAPVSADDKVYFASDDGNLYCLGAADGKLLWKFRGLPEGRETRRVMGNGRLIPLVPMRGGPVLANGVVYFAAGIWWGEGVFVHAIDAATGKPVWSNVEVQKIEKANMDHGVGYFAGLSPQGHLAIVDGRLVVPCGAQLPALLDLKTGKLATYTMGWGGRTALPKGCSFVAGIGQYLLHGGDLFDIRRPNDERFSEPRSNDFKGMLYPAGITRLQIDRTNQKGLGAFREPVLTETAMYYQEDGIVACDLTKPKIEERAAVAIPSHRKNDQYPDKLRGQFPELWRLAGKSAVHLKAGNQLFCSRPGVVEAITLPSQGNTPKPGWKGKVEGTPYRMLAADGKLFVVTREGSLYAFGAKKPAKPIVHKRPAQPAPTADAWTEKATKILDVSGTRNGYVVALGIGSGRLVEELVRQSSCDVIVIDPDAEKVARFRNQFHEAGLYGSRISLFVGEPASYRLPPYLASLIVSENPASLGKEFTPQLAKHLFRSLRPYGGSVCFSLPGPEQESLVRAAANARLPRGDVRKMADLLLLTRLGALPDSGNWSHSGANAANTGAAEDRFLKPPLARLWFDSTFRWFRTPGTTIVRVAAGRVLVKSAKLDAIDVYTGRHLWRAELPKSHNPAGEIVALDDAIYLTNGPACVILDPATGSKVGTLDLPAEVGGRLVTLRVEGDFLVGASGKHVVCMNRHDGKVLWTQERERKTGPIALGGGKVFCADFVLRKRGQPAPDTSGMTTEAFDLATGKPLWQMAGAGEVRYSESLDLVVAAGGVYSASDGTRKYNAGGTWPVSGNKLLTGSANGFTLCDLATGEKAGEPWKWNRRGCTSLRASSHLLTTRFQGNAAYVDLATGKITSIWNVRAACSNNLFPANGVLNLPNLSGGCTCNYLPMSQALVPVSVFVE